MYMYISQHIHLLHDHHTLHSLLATEAAGHGTHLSIVRCRRLLRFYTAQKDPDAVLSVLADAGSDRGGIPSASIQPDTSRAS